MQLVITGIRPYDGSYDFDMESEPLTTLEWRWVKKISGYLPLTLQDGFDGGDPDLIVALAVVALRRAGKIMKEQAFQAADRIADAPFDGAALQLIADPDDETEADAEGDAVPPAEASPTS